MALRVLVSALVERTVLSVATKGPVARRAPVCPSCSQSGSVCNVPYQMGTFVFQRHPNLREVCSSGQYGTGACTCNTGYTGGNCSSSVLVAPAIRVTVEAPAWTRPAAPATRLRRHLLSARLPGACKRVQQSRPLWSMVPARATLDTAGQLLCPLPRSDNICSGRGICDVTGTCLCNVPCVGSWRGAACVCAEDWHGLRCKQKCPIAEQFSAEATVLARIRKSSVSVMRTVSTGSGLALRAINAYRGTTGRLATENALVGLACLASTTGCALVA